MARKHKTPQPTREEQVTSQVTLLVEKWLSSENITPPNMVFDMLMMGYRCWRPGMGLPHENVWQAIAEGFENQHRPYLTPRKIALLRGKTQWDPSDFEHLKE